jgi:hypothetical protein
MRLRKPNEELKWAYLTSAHAFQTTCDFSPELVLLSRRSAPLRITFCGAHS